MGPVLHCLVRPNRSVTHSWTTFPKLSPNPTSPGYTQFTLLYPILVDFGSSQQLQYPHSEQLNNLLCPPEAMASCEFHAPTSPAFVNPRQNGKIVTTSLKKMIQQENHWHNKKSWIFRTCHPVPKQNLTYKWTGRSTYRSGWRFTPGPLLHMWKILWALC